MRLYTAVLVLLLSLVLTGCNNGPKEKPRVADVAGAYHLSPASRRYLKENKHYASVEGSRIILRKDGTLSVIRLPDCYVNRFGKSDGKLLSGQGRWEIDSTYSGYGVTLAVGKGGSLDPALYSGTSITIRHSVPPYALEFLIGDPDEDESIVYVK